MFTALALRAMCPRLGRRHRHNDNEPIIDPEAAARARRRSRPGFLRRVLAGAITLLGVVALASGTGCERCGTDPEEPRDRVVLSLRARPALSNCQPTAATGAGITGMTITLAEAGGSCAPITFVRARGGLPVGAYTVNCSSPTVATCIETDETLSVAALAPGRYTIRVRGKLGGVDCWANDDVLEVPPPGQSLVRTLALARSTAPGC
jgi:hypothetical protein